MKENNGERARRVLWRRVRLTGVVLLVVGLLVWVVVGGGGPMMPRRAQTAPYSHWRRRSRIGQPLPSSSRAFYRSNGNNDDGDDDDSDRRVEDKEDLIQAILRGDVTLVGLDAQGLQVDRNTGRYANVRGHFCAVDWTAHKENPSTTPMFRDVLAQSPPCSSHHGWVDLAQLVPRVRQYDHDPSAPHTLHLGGVVFHESRCGSTLVANLLQAASPDAHRVYSESPPPIEALKQGQRGFPVDRVVAPLVRDVFYLMSRSTQRTETTVFFKIQSVGSRDMSVFRAAFPDTPFIFVFRDPVEVLMSHFALGRDRLRQANCARSYAHPPSIVRARSQQRDESSEDDDDDENQPERGHPRPSVEEFCAAHLATLTETALHHVTAPGSRGRAVEYTQLPDILWETVLPQWWDVPLAANDVARMQVAAGQYSKGRGAKAGAAFGTDSERKQAAAWEGVQTAARQFLAPSYQRLQALAAAG